ncbi:hypothetical protein DP112_10540 [Streptococcus suis]|uniref:Uncharacterized protein n=2 Tax=Streptococcus suis TaxID=1307 RepID=A0A3S6K4P8_STRSU|nr:hypothetical protein DP112_10540 [Streptococcus suis]
MEAAMKKLLKNHFFYLTTAFLLILVIYFSGIDKRWIILASFLYFIPSQILYRRRLKERLQENQPK